MRFLVSLIIVVGLAILIRLLKPKRSIVGLLLIAYFISVLIVTLGTRNFDHETHIGWNPIVVYVRAIKSVVQGYKAGELQEALKHLRCHKGQFGSVGLNVLLFVPLGYLMPYGTFRRIL